MHAFQGRSMTVAAVADRRTLRRIRPTLLAWYRASRRDLPWRLTTDPYAVLVSEVMLQQTQASRIAEAFPPFMSRFPSAAALAAATAGEVLAAWRGLGYNRRALALWRAAAIVHTEGWPRDVPSLRQLPGVGPYTARAIASAAFGEAVGVVDTNVRRWLIRRLGLPLGAPPRLLQQIADELAAGAADGAEAAAWTHASMEFGARVCGRRPACGDCPIAAGCPARNIAPRVPVRVQTRYVGSRRAVRGAVVRCLADAAGHSLERHRLEERIGAEASRIGVAADAAMLDGVLASLELDGLIHRRGSALGLGDGKPGPGRRAATIRR